MTAGISLSVRFAVLKRDRFTCVYCGAHPPQVEIEVDHFQPASRGGTDDIGNLVTACWDCNHGKGTSLFDYDGELPEVGSPLWRWIELGEKHENDRLCRIFLGRDDRTFAEVVESLWPEADY